MEAYGIGVRGGALTPQMKDEEHFRNALELPDAEEAVMDAWDEDGGARRPITLKSQEAFEEEQNQIVDEDAQEDEQQDEQEEELVMFFIFLQPFTYLYTLCYLCSSFCF